MYENILVETYIGRKQIVIARRLLQLVGASAYWQAGKASRATTSAYATEISPPCPNMRHLAGSKRLPVVGKAGQGRRALIGKPR